MFPKNDLALFISCFLQKISISSELSVYFQPFALGKSSVGS